MVVYDLGPGRETAKKNKGNFCMCVIEVFFIFITKEVMRFYKICQNVLNCTFKMGAFFDIYRIFNKVENNNKKSLFMHWLNYSTVLLPNHLN